MKLVISGNSSEYYFSQRDGLSSTKELKSLKSEWIELDYLEWLGGWNEEHKALKEFS